MHPAMKSAFLMAVLPVFFLMAPLAQASPGAPVYQGTGCPPDTAETVWSEENATLTVLFSRFVVEAGGATGSGAMRGACDLALPIDVPAGYQLGVYKIDYRGFVSLPKKGAADLSVDLSVGSGKIAPFHRHLPWTQSGEFTLTDTIGAGQMKWTGCGERVTLQLHSELSVQSNAQNEQALASLDSADGTRKGAIRYRVQWRKCQ
jgi:hypothetical protein